MTRNSALVWFGVLLGASQLGTLACRSGNPTEENLRVRSIQIVDQDGKPRMDLGVDEGGARIELLDPNGAPSLRIEVANDVSGGTPKLVFRDPHGRARLIVGEKSIQLGDVDTRLEPPWPVIVAYDEHGELGWTCPEQLKTDVTALQGK